MRRFRRAVTGLLAAGTLLAALAGCAAPAYNYVSDSADGAYFKVPASWPQVSAQSLAEAQETLGKSEAGPTGGTVAWSRAYAGGSNPQPTELFSAANEPVVYASVQDLHMAFRAVLSFDYMRDLIFPVTPAARAEAAAEGAKLSGFNMISNATIATSGGVRGINVLFEYDVGGAPDVFDQTVMTNAATTKLYLLLVQCYQNCFLAHRDQIATVVNSFTVEGSS
jgi:hypothetical protein